MVSAAAVPSTIRLPWAKVIPAGTVRLSRSNRAGRERSGVMGFLSRPGAGRHRPCGAPDLKRRMPTRVAPDEKTLGLPFPHRGGLMTRLAVGLVLLAVPVVPVRGDETVTGKHGMVVCVSPEAADVGLAVLKEGGNAVD